MFLYLGHLDLGDMVVGVGIFVGVQMLDNGNLFGKNLQWPFG